MYNRLKQLDTDKYINWLISEYEIMSFIPYLPDIESIVTDLQIKQGKRKVRFYAKFHESANDDRLTDSERKKLQTYTTQCTEIKRVSYHAIGSLNVDSSKIKRENFYNGTCLTIAQLKAFKLDINQLQYYFDTMIIDIVEDSKKEFETKSRQSALSSVEFIKSCIDSELDHPYSYLELLESGRLVEGLDIVKYRIPFIIELARIKYVQYLICLDEKRDPILLKPKKQITWLADKYSLGTLFALFHKHGIIEGFGSDIKRMIVSNFDGFSSNTLDDNFKLSTKTEHGKITYSTEVETATKELIKLLKNQASLNKK